MPRPSTPRAVVTVRVGQDAASSSVLLDWAVQAFVPGTGAQVHSRPGRRPLVRGAVRLYASGSGTSGAAAAAVGDRPVGIDVELLRSVREVASVATLLEGVESPWPGTGPDEDTVVRWTRYEAVVKALGVGMILPPSAVRIDRAGAVAIRGSPVPLRVESWLAGSSAGQTTHAVSLATRPEVTLRHLPPSK